MDIFLHPCHKLGDLLIQLLYWADIGLVHDEVKYRELREDDQRCGEHVGSDESSQKSYTTDPEEDEGIESTKDDDDNGEENVEHKFFFLYGRRLWCYCDRRCRIYWGILFTNDAHTSLDLHIDVFLLAAIHLA